MKAIIIVPGIAELESRSLFVSNYAPIVEGGPGAQRLQLLALRDVLTSLLQRSRSTASRARPSTT